MSYSLEFFEKSAEFLRKNAPFQPETAVILGSCLGPFAREIQDPVTVPYRDIPNFLLSTVESHAGELIFGTVAGRKVVCMSGRFHSYEGYSFEQLVIPIRVLKRLGVRAVLLTNAAGAVNPAYQPGDVMVIADHIKLNGNSPLRGPNEEAFGPRFFDVSRMYTPALRRLALERAADVPELRVHEGTYLFFPGPQFETPAEIRAARILGGDAVGMSTVTEALTAAHCGLPLLGLSVLTNMAAGVLDQPLSAGEVDETAQRVAAPFSRYVQSLIKAIGEVFFA